MRHALRISFYALCFVLVSIGISAQAQTAMETAQENFSLAVATAHARTSLFVAGSRPFVIHATATSSLALHGSGKGIYDNEWMDAQHWHRSIRFPDYQSVEMRNDSGHSWIERSDETMPIRVAELLRIVVIHLPTSTAAASYPVAQTSEVGEHGEALTCYGGDLPELADGFRRTIKYCFEKSSGLLVTQDVPLNVHIVYSNYIEFQGKHEYTHVRMTSGNLPALDIDIRYEPLDAHALDAAMPDAAMQRSANASTTPNPEEMRKGSVEYRFNPPLPPGTPDADKDKPVQMQLHVSAENKLLDACVEDAPTLAMGEAALQAVQKLTFTPLTVDGKPVESHFYYSVWFRSGADGGASHAGNVPEPENDAPTVSGVSSLGSQYSMYQNEDPPFAFRYPKDFQRIPKTQLENELRVSKEPHQYSLDMGKACDTLLFKAQRPPSSDARPDVLTIYDLAPNCVFNTLDKKTLEGIAEGAARSVLGQLSEGSTSKAKGYTSDGQNFATANSFGVSRGTMPGPVNIVTVVSAIRGHVIAWVMVSTDKERAVKMLGDSTLQVEARGEVSLFPASGRP